MTANTEDRNILVTCPRGMTPWLKAEMEELGMDLPRELDAGVQTRGTLEDCMRLNLHLRTGHRVLWELKRFKAENPNQLYSAVRSIVWERYLDPDGYFSVSSSVRNDTIRDTRFPNLKVKDGIADRFMRKFKRRPDSGPDRHKSGVFLYWRGEWAVLYLDTTGEPLPKRGYRKRPHSAPMQESLAAACILASRWPEKSAKGENFIAPMCGSGTLAIEAALMGLNRAPGLQRSNFAFMHSPGFDRERWDELRAEAKAQAQKSLPGRIIATDNDPKAVEAAKANAETAGVAHLIDFDVCDFSETEVPEGSGVVMLNPEYGMRLGDEEALVPMYKGIGDFFKQSCGGYFGYIFTGNLGLAKRVGLRTKRRIIFYNAKIECRLLEYELYAGSKKSPQKD